MGRLEADLNPDVPTKDLHVLDQQAVAKFNGEIYKLIRAGQRKEAIERCLQSGQSWKAAMMEGAGSDKPFLKRNELFRKYFAIRKQGRIRITIRLFLIWRATLRERKLGTFGSWRR